MHARVTRYKPREWHQRQERRALAAPRSCTDRCGRRCVAREHRRTAGVRAQRSSLQEIAGPLEERPTATAPRELHEIGCVTERKGQHRHTPSNLLPRHTRARGAHSLQHAVATHTIRRHPSGSREAAPALSSPRYLLETSTRCRLRWQHSPCPAIGLLPPHLRRHFSSSSACWLLKGRLLNVTR